MPVTSRVLQALQSQDEPYRSWSNPSVRSRIVSPEISPIKDGSTDRFHERDYRPSRSPGISRAETDYSSMAARSVLIAAPSPRSVTSVW